MAGSESSGYKASDSLLLENAYYLLTPGQGFPTESIEKMKHFLSSIGSIPFVMSPEEHDKTVACVSHLPHLIAASLVKLLKEEDEKGCMKKLAAGGFKDISRIASAQGLIHSEYAISLHVQDHPGAISIISTILASNMVSIRNLGINHNREKGEGALQISFYTGEDCEMAKKLLHKYGFVF